MYFWLRLISILRTASEILFVFCVFTKSGTGGGGWCHLNGGTLLDSAIVRSWLGGVTLVGTVWTNSYLVAQMGITLTLGELHFWQERWFWF